MKEEKKVAVSGFAILALRYSLILNYIIPLTFPWSAISERNAQLCLQPMDMDG